MKILGINGSPNKTGATAKLIKMLLDECRLLGAKTELVDVEDFISSSCVECGKCDQDLNCNYEDDFVQLKAKMLDSDGIIIGSPYYNGRPTEQIEAFFSRLKKSRTVDQFSDKYFVGVATSSVSDCSSIAKYCANLGKPSFLFKGQICGYICESMMTENFVKDISGDGNVTNKVKSLAEKFIEDIKLKRHGINKNKGISKYGINTGMVLKKEKNQKKYKIL